MKFVIILNWLNLQLNLYFHHKNPMKIYQVKQDRKSVPTRGIKSNPGNWLKQKAERDAELTKTDTSNLWIVQNKLYDLNPFIHSHPGGSNWLTMTKGQDVTDFFVTHHLDEDKAREVLKKYYVGQTKSQLNRFSYEENGFYRTVKRQVLKEMSIEQIQNESISKVYAFIILGLLLSSYALAGLSIDTLNPGYAPYLYGACSAVLLLGMIGVGHNFVHHKQNFFRFFFLATGFTHNEWQIMHTLSHHIYPNMELDYETAAMEPVAYFLRNQPENKFYTEIILNLVVVIIYPLNFLMKFLVTPLIKKQLPDFWYLVPTLVFFYFYACCGDWFYSLKLFIFIYCLFGLFLSRILLCGHRVQYLWSEGAERIQDFGEHTMASTGDTDTWITGFLSLLLLGGFNIHTPHHLFPTADHAALYKMLPIVDRVCTRMGIKHYTSNRFACYASFSKGLRTRIPFVRKN